MNTFEILLLIFTAFYSLCLIYFYFGIMREERRSEDNNVVELPRVSVIVAARNERLRIEPLLKSLSMQDYPVDRFEVFIVDDRSSDGTAEFVNNYIKTHHLERFRCLQHRPDTAPTFKKHALLHGISASSGDIILTTDADCAVPGSWIRTMITRYDAKTGLVAGLVSYEAAEDSLFQRVQALEFAGLVFTGVGAIGNGTPLICNASNLSYRRAAFDAVNGFSGHEHIPSGDDDLLMQNIHERSHWQIRYNLHPDSIVKTQPVETVADFLNQRARWASKSRDYPGSHTFFVLLAIYLFYVLLALAIPLALLGFFSGWSVFTAFLMKLGSEFMVVRHAAKTLGHSGSLLLFPLAQGAQSLYILIAGFAGFFKLYRWRSA